MFDWLIVGAGFAGSVLAERLASRLGELVLLIDRRPHVGGNTYDRFDETGALVPLYGRHVLQTDDLDVLRYLSQFTLWRHCAPAEEWLGDHRKPGSDPHGRTEEHASLRVDPGPQVDPGVATIVPKSPVGASRITGLKLDNFFEVVEGDDLSGLAGRPLIPAEGYARMFERMLSHPNIKLMLNSDYREIRNIIPFRRLVYTGSIDEYFDCCYGKLPYQPVTSDERGYPAAEAGGEELFRRYEELADASTDVFFIGRLATYRYCPMHQVVAQALATFERIAARTDDSEREPPLGASGRPFADQGDAPR